MKVEGGGAGVQGENEECALLELYPSPILTLSSGMTAGINGRWKGVGQDYKVRMRKEVVGACIVD